MGESRMQNRVMKKELKVAQGVQKTALWTAILVSAISAGGCAQDPMAVYRSGPAREFDPLASTAAGSKASASNRSERAVTHRAATSEGAQRASPVTPLDMR